MGRNSLFIFLGLFVNVCYGQQQTYYVQFKDKNASVYSTDAPKDFLSARSISRRHKNKIAIDHRDLPVNQSYIDQVIAAGAQLVYPLKWFNGVVVRSDEVVKNQLTSLSCVQSVDESVKFRKGKSATLSNLSMSRTYTDFGDAYDQNAMIGIPQMHHAGYRGQGILIAITDDGFLNVDNNPGFTTLFQQGKIKGTWDIVDMDASLYTQGGGHGSAVFSILAGHLPGQFSGPALDANFMLFRTEDVASESPLEELNWVRAAEIADSAGVDIIQVSLGYTTFDDASLNYTWADLDGKTSYISQGASVAYDKGIIVVASAGNEGDDPWKKISCPADVDGVLAVGAVDYNGSRSHFSSVGNTADGRIKPDVMAMGNGVIFIAPSGFLSSGAGTSFSSPLVSGLVAGLMQAYPGLTHQEIITCVKRSADRYQAPDAFYGYGIPHFSGASYYANLLSDKESLYIFPNPFGAQLNIKVPASALGSAVEWSLYAMTGQKVAEGQQVIGDTMIALWSDGDSLRSGVYLLRASIGGVFHTFRIIK